MKSLSVVLNPADRRSHINRAVYGHFSEHLGGCIYGGLWVGKDSPVPNTDGFRTDIIEAFRAIGVPVLRWPGGCFAEDYRWRDGIGDPAARPGRINAYWGGVPESNAVGTHEFMRLCELIGCEPYLAVNMASATVREASDWIEYMCYDGQSDLADERRRNGREEPWPLTYVGLGNENWGAGGAMSPEYYADTYRHYQSYVRNLGRSHLFRVACGPNEDDYHWTEVLMNRIHESQVDALSLHYYTLPSGDWERKGSALEYDRDEYYRTIRRTLRMDEIVRKHGAIIRRYSDHVGLAVDEWGTWYDVEPGTNPGFLYQQNTMRDAIVAACNLNIFNRRSDVVCMANLAQAVNVLQALVLALPDPSQPLVLTPTYHVFDLFRTHQDAENIYCHIADVPEVEGMPALSYSASLDGDGVITLTLANISLEENLQISLPEEWNVSEARLLHAEDVHAHNDFTDPEQVRPAHVTVTGGPVVIPACSVMALRLTSTRRPS